MKKIKVFAALLAIAFVVVASSFTTRNTATDLEEWGLVSKSSVYTHMGTQFIDIVAVELDYPNLVPSCSEVSTKNCEIEFDDTEVLNGEGDADDQVKDLGTISGFPERRKFRVKASDFSSFVSMLDANKEFSYTINP